MKSIYKKLFFSLLFAYLSSCTSSQFAKLMNPGSLSAINDGSDEEDILAKKNHVDSMERMPGSSDKNCTKLSYDKLINGDLNELGSDAGICQFISDYFKTLTGSNPEISIEPPSEEEEEKNKLRLLFKVEIEGKFSQEITTRSGLRITTLRTLINEMLVAQEILRSKQRPGKIDWSEFKVVDFYITMKGE